MSCLWWGWRRGDVRNAGGGNGGSVGAVVLAINSSTVLPIEA